MKLAETFLEALAHVQGPSGTGRPGQALSPPLSPGLVVQFPHGGHSILNT